MLAYTRERVIVHLHEIPPLIDLYQMHNPLFIEKTIVWLDSVENSLMQLRNPLASFVATERGKIIPRRIYGNCARHQRKLTDAIKKARQIALMPYAGPTYL